MPQSYHEVQNNVSSLHFHIYKLQNVSKIRRPKQAKKLIELLTQKSNQRNNNREKKKDKIKNRTFIKTWHDLIKLNIA